MTSAIPNERRVCGAVIYRIAIEWLRRDCRGGRGEESEYDGDQDSAREKETFHFYLVKPF